MSETEKPVPAARENEFQQQAEQKPVGILWEFVDFLRYNKAWWLTPIIIVLLLVGGVMFLAGSGAGAFIYTLF
jgi:hypothetical protein